MPGIDDRVADIRAVFIVFIPLVCLSLTLRCYVRGWVVRAFGWDDGLMILAFVCTFSHLRYGPVCLTIADHLRQCILRAVLLRLQEHTMGLVIEPRT